MHVQENEVIVSVFVRSPRGPSCHMSKERIQTTGQSPPSPWQHHSAVYRSSVLRCYREVITVWYFVFIQLISLSIMPSTLGTGFHLEDKLVLNEFNVMMVDDSVLYNGNVLRSEAFPPKKKKKCGGW